MLVTKESPDIVIISPAEHGHKSRRQGEDALREKKKEASVRRSSIKKIRESDLFGAANLIHLHCEGLSSVSR
jgi:hypothetical protein